VSNAPVRPYKWAGDVVVFQAVCFDHFAVSCVQSPNVGFASAAQSQCSLREVLGTMN
jgi:hypothetical protein